MEVFMNPQIFIRGPWSPCWRTRPPGWQKAPHIT